MHKSEVEDVIKKRIHRFAIGSHIEVSLLVELAVNALFKDFKKYASNTGVVIAGFADQDYFPAYEEYSCLGVLNGKCLFEKTNSAKIDTNTPSDIKAFATTGMIDTFLTGCSPDVFSEIYDQFKAGLLAFSECLKKELQVQEIPNLDDNIDMIVKDHTSNWIDRALTAHSWPLRRIIGSLPIDEMAELAETLITLQSIKEK